MGIIINNSGKFEDLVLMIAKRQTYRHTDTEIETFDNVGVRSHIVE